MAASLPTLLLGEFTPSPSVPGRFSFNIAQRPLKERLGLGAYYEVMGKLSIERVKELQREIAEIAAGNHALSLVTIQSGFEINNFARQLASRLL